MKPRRSTDVAGLDAVFPEDDALSEGIESTGWIEVESTEFGEELMEGGTSRGVELGGKAYPEQISRCRGLSVITQAS